MRRFHEYYYYERREISSSTSTVHSSNVSTSRMLTAYEISDDLQRRRVEVLERRYGGRERAHAAATLIQRAFREWSLDRRFKEMMLSSHGGHSHRQSQLYSMKSFAALPTTGTSSPRQFVVSPLQRIAPPVEADFRRGSPSRYTPSTSLTAQLRGDRGGVLSPPSSLLNENCRPRAGTRSPPSPAPSSRTPRGSATMIESLMSPRLVARRMIGGPPTSPLLMSPEHPNGPPVPIVWVPRASVPYAPHPYPSNGYDSPMLNGGHGQQVNGHQSRPLQHVPRQPQPLHHTHSNSLPRVDKRERRERVEQLHASQQRSLSDVERKRQYRVALNFFNKNPARGVQLLTQWGFVDETPESLAKLMFGRRGLSKQMIGEFLGQHGSPFHTYVLDYFIGQIDVRGMEVDAALRKVLSYFRLPGEAQKIERVMQAFSTQYARANPSRAACFTGGADTVFVLAFAVIMLNTDLHSRSIRPAQRMSKADFIKNLNGVDAGQNMDKDMLSGIYERIRAEEFVHGDDHVAQVARVEEDIVGKDKPRLSECHRRLVCYCRLHAIVDVTKRQGEGVHERDVFLFNDTIVVTKSVAKKKSKSGFQYMLKASSPLLGARVQLFSNAHYAFGIDIDCRPHGPQMLFSAKNCDDRIRFVHDVHEAILECAQMETVRLEMEYGKQHGVKSGVLSSRKGSSSSSSPLPVAVPKVVESPSSEASSGLRSDNSQRDSGLPDEMDQNCSSGTDSASSGASSSSLVPPTNGTLITDRAANRNASRATFSRRLSFNSLDSGVVEEHFDSAAL